MTDEIRTNNPELEALFDRYRSGPESYVFAPLADACRKAGMLEEARSICDRGVAIHPGYASGHVVRGKCYYDSGDSETARVCFKEVLHLDANNLVALKYLGMIHSDAGETERAREHFKHILALDPDDKEIKARLEQLDAEPVPERKKTESPARRAKKVSVSDTSEKASDTADEAADEDDVAEKEKANDGFEGPDIVLGADAPVTSDELATLTLADIYASQGYADKALKIYRELHRLRPGDETIRAKIAELSGDEPREQAPEESTEETPGVLVEPAAEPRSETAEPGAPNLPSDDLGDKSYEQFRRWLKNLS